MENIPIQKVSKLSADAHKGDDLADLLNHIGWTDVILPRLRQEQKFYDDLLRSAVLGIPPTIRLSDGTVGTLNKEQLAARAEAVTWLERLFERILRKGLQAEDDLRRIGLNP